MKQKQLVVLVGPTAVGKTAMAVQLALHFGTEVISADSRQVYRELSIGTAKPGPAELAAVKHHFISVKALTEDYDAGQFGRDVLALLPELFNTHEKVILCGGSGLYIKSVTEGFDEMPEVPASVRQEIAEKYRAGGLKWLQQQVEEADPDYFAVVDRQNPHRLMRALELSRVTLGSVTSLRKASRHNHDFEIVKIGLDLERGDLYRRIDQRIDSMIEAGLFQEAEQLYPQRELNALQTVGYREIFGFMDGRYDRTEAIRLLRRNTRRYAKRQLTWFRKDKEIKWFSPDAYHEILKLLEG